MNSYVENSEVEMFFRIFSGNKLRDFFEKNEKYERIRRFLIYELSTLNLLCGSK